MSDRKEFLRQYTRALREGNAGLFVGAGMSVAAGYVDWKGLLKDIAADMGLDVDQEADLIAVAQYHENGANGRNLLNQTLLDHFVESTTLTNNHHIIASLPVRSVWTTNYDSLLETAFESADRRASVKRRDVDLATTRQNSDVTIFKMHGDITSPTEAVLTKEDYERYDTTHPLFVVALKGDLVNKTFLFLGVSMTDPNIAYILGRVKQLLEGNARTHYCILKRPKAGADGATEYTCARFPHWLKDLQRYRISPVLIDSYAEITEILLELNRRSHLLDVFISGSAHEHPPIGKDRFESFCRDLGRTLIEKNFNVISGFGVGVGGIIIVGAMDALRRNDDHRLQLWPFPQTVPDGMDRSIFWAEYRKKMLANAGICIVIAGNKNEGSGVVLANGVREEVRIAREGGTLIIPVGATGYVAKEMWDEANNDPKSYFGDLNVTAELAVIGNESASNDDIIKAIIEIARKADR